MKKFFNRAGKSHREQECYEDEVFLEEEYYGEEEYYAEDEAYEEYAEEEYYAENGEYVEDEYYTENEGYTEETYYPENEEYIQETYNTENEEYTQEAYYAENEEYTEETYYAENKVEAEPAYYAENGEYIEEAYYPEDGQYVEDGQYAEDTYYTDPPCYQQEYPQEYEQDYYEEEQYREGIYTQSPRKIFDFMGSIDRIVAVAGVAVLIIALITGGIYVSARMVDKQMEEFVKVGTQLEGIDLIGEEGLMAVEDAQLAKLEAAKLVEEEEKAKQPEYNEAEYSNLASVQLNMVSIQKDLKIKFTNKETDKLIPNVPFSVTATDPDGKVINWTDDDMDGIIYKKGITPGNYKISVDALTDSKYKDYLLPVGTQSVEVKKDIAYEKVNVKNEIKSESQVNVAQEDTKKKETVQESSLENTTKWLESTVTDNTYIEILKNTIPDPATVAKANEDSDEEDEDVSGNDVEDDDEEDEDETAAEDDTESKLLDENFRQVYVLEESTYREAVYADYYVETQFFLKGDSKYTGWQTIDGKVYFFDATGKKVTGEQIIQGAKYTFASDGSLVTGTSVMGIDVSKWNGSIDWNAVKNSGVSYVIIRCGYRGSSQGALIEDSTYRTNIKGAIDAGLNVGVYFFTQAIDEVEAVEEASMVLELVNGYRISYPIFLDVEASGGRADSLDKATRTAVCKAFCETIQGAGYTAGIYANKTWLTEKIDTGALGGYKIWLAQYAATPTYTGRYDIWQYSESGRVSGISGNVDLNTSYLGY